MKNSVIITGATGFIGRYLLMNLLSKEYTVCAVIRSEEKKEGLMEYLKKSKIDLSNLSFLISDLNDISPEKFENESYDAWFHLAWEGVNRDNINNSEIQERNVIFSIKCLQCAKELNCTFFSDFGSRAEYPAEIEVIEEKMPKTSLNAYGDNKKVFFEHAVNYCKEYNMKYIHYRVFSAFGPDDHPWSLVMTACRSFVKNEPMEFGACNQMWNYLDVRDLTNQVVLVFERVMNAGNAEARDMEIGEGIVNIASRTSRPLKEYIMDIYEVCDSSSRLTFGDNKGFASVPKLDRLDKLGIKFQEIPFKDSIRDIIDTIN